MRIDPLTKTEITDELLRREIALIRERVESARTEQAEIVYLERLRKLEEQLQEQAK